VLVPGWGGSVGWAKVVGVDHREGEIGEECKTREKLNS